MPSPLDVLLDPISLAVFAIYAALVLWEYLVPGRPLPHARAWPVRGLLAFVAYFAISTYLPLVLTEYLQPLQLFDLSHLGTLAGAAIGLLVYELCGYAYHRSMHSSNVLWRGLHQMHHSAERVDTFGAFWFHPTDMIGWTLVSSIALTVIVGLSAQATTVVLLTVTLLSIFQHANIRTPRWLGYVVQRPESHSWHHARGRHRDNYADLPVFDLLFGTFDNPRDFAPANGFYDGASLRLADMLAFRDVAAPPADASAARAAA
jgi:sterol desaturase/sphingolipid hydroxylase (fatty acid hydroxylase superfamily)